jgi:transcriptional regulator with XRE-family HTH domain
MRERINLRNALGLDDPRFEAQRAEIRQQLEIAQKIYNLREERGLTQAETAKLGRTTSAVINQIEESDYDLTQSLRILERITESLEGSPSSTLAPTGRIVRPA